MHIILKKKYLLFYNYKIKCSIGKKGLTSKKKEGDLKTPRGKFKFVLLLYRKDRNHNFHCNIKKKIIKKNMGWCDDPNSESYNKLVNFSTSKKETLQNWFLYKQGFRNNQIFCDSLAYAFFIFSIELVLLWPS